MNFSRGVGGSEKLVGRNLKVDFENHEKMDKIH